jgi:hypothetical protein
MTSDVATIEAGLLDAFGAAPDGDTRRRIRRAAELVALADRARSAALAGNEFGVGELARLESVADDAMSALGLPLADDRGLQWDLTKLNDSEFELLQSVLQSVAGKCAVGEPPPSVGDRLIELHAKHQATVVELDRERDRAWKLEDALHSTRSELVRTESELSRHRRALEEVARALAESEAKATEVASAGSSRGPDNVVPIKRTPAESPDCTPVTDRSDYSFLDVGSGSDRFGHRGPA